VAKQQEEQMKLKSVTVFPFNNDKSKGSVAFASAHFEQEDGSSLILREMTVVNGANGLFLGFPQHKIPAKADKPERYEDTFALAGTLKAETEKAVLSMYEQKKQGATATA
jgi:DNA-binding cell septation regulator SpoVG